MVSLALSILEVFIFIQIVSHIFKKDNVDIQVSRADSLIAFVVMYICNTIVLNGADKKYICIYLLTILYLTITSYIDIKTKYIYNIVNIIYFIISIIYIGILILFSEKIDFTRGLIGIIVLFSFILINKVIRAIEMGDIDLLVSLYVVLITKNVGYTDYKYLILPYKIAFNPVLLVILLSVIIGSLGILIRLIKCKLKFSEIEHSAFSPYIAIATVIVLILL